MEKTNNITSAVKRGKNGSSFIYAAENWRTFAAMNKITDENRRAVGSRKRGREKWVGGVDIMVQEIKNVVWDEIESVVSKRIGIRVTHSNRAADIGGVNMI